MASSSLWKKNYIIWVWIIQPLSSCKFNGNTYFFKSSWDFFLFPPWWILCKTDDKALEGDLWFPGDPNLGECWWSKTTRSIYGTNVNILQFNLIQVNKHCCAKYPRRILRDLCHWGSGKGSQMGGSWSEEEFSTAHFLLFQLQTIWENCLMPSEFWNMFMPTNLNTKLKKLLSWLKKKLTNII